MGMNAVLDVVIGLVLMYLLLSLIVTVVNEFFASVLKLRAGNLKQGIENLIDDPNVRAAFQDSPLIRVVGQVSGGKGPSYLPSKTFALALLDAANPGSKVTETSAYADIVGAMEKLPPSNVKDVLLAFARETGEDVESLRLSISGWFDDMMERAAGVYKRKLQMISLLVSLGLAFALNADTFMVAKALWTDETLRGQIAETAKEFVEGTGYMEDMMELEEIQADLRPFPIGWEFGTPAASTDWNASFRGFLLKVLGLVLTGLAVSLGAPFWFDLLSKFVKLRGSGGTPKRQAPQQKATEGGTA